MTLAAFCGAGGLGYLVYAGIRSINNAQILAGAIPACILALFFDYILGIVENMSYVQCPDCGKKIFVFGKSHLQDVADKYDLKILGQLPLDSELTQLSDMGMIENYSSDWLDEFEEKVKNF